MADTFKRLDPNQDVITKQFPLVSSLYTITESTQSLTSDVSLLTIGGCSGYNSMPDASGTNGNISFSGAMNEISKFFFDRFTPGFYDSTNGIYTLPASHSSSVSVSFAKVIQISRPTLSHGIWPDTVTAILNYSNTSVTAVDAAYDSIGPNKESLEYGSLVDIGSSANVIGTIFYSYGIILLHGGTGNVYTQLVQKNGINGDNFFWGNTGTGTTTALCQSISFSTYTLQVSNVYFCRMLNNEFNYTSNPSAKNVAFLQREENATTYVTTIGLYDDRDNMLAVAKLSPPVKKNKYTERNFAVTLTI